MNPPVLTESRIREESTAESFRRGQGYFEHGAVASMTKRGSTLDAEVEGGQPEAYRVRVQFHPDGNLETYCDCRYSWGGWCKHIVAALLAFIHTPDIVEERPPLDELLSTLNREQIQRLIVSLAEKEPHLIDAIEVGVALAAATSAPPCSPTGEWLRHSRVSVDPKPFRRQIREALRRLDYIYPSEFYWHVVEIARDVRGLLDQIWGFTRAGDGRNALVLLDVVTEELLDSFKVPYYSYGEIDSLFRDLGLAWAESILAAGLSAAEMQGWRRKLEAWRGDMEFRGIGEAFDVALDAAEQGWEDPLLQSILQGEFSGWDEPQGEPLSINGDLIAARLNVLQYLGRHEELLNLARAAGQVERYAVELVRLGRVDEAVECALRQLVTAEQALALGKALRERGEIEQALKVARHGLSLKGWKGALASWLRELTAGMGRTEQALEAAVIAFQEDANLAAYLRAQDLAGDGWPELRIDLLDRLRRANGYYGAGPVDVFLHEGLVDYAIAALDGGAPHNLVRRVVDAAMESRPDWAIQACRRQAEPIMEEGKAQYYDVAVRWLSKARRAYRIAGRDGEWWAYIEELIERHRRKYKLVPMLKTLR